MPAWRPTAAGGRCTISHIAECPQLAVGWIKLKIQTVPELRPRRGASSLPAAEVGMNPSAPWPLQLLGDRSASGTRVHPTPSHPELLRPHGAAPGFGVHPSRQHPRRQHRCQGTLPPRALTNTAASCPRPPHRLHLRYPQGWSCRHSSRDQETRAQGRREPRAAGLDPTLTLFKAPLQPRSGQGSGATSLQTRAGRRPLRGAGRALGELLSALYPPKHQKVSIILPVTHF